MPESGDDDEASAEGSALFLSAVEEPIEEDAPGGSSVTYDEDFRELKTQIDEIGSASGDADYERITELARRILTEKSKDLRAAGYLVIGESRLNGSSGLARGVRAVRVLIDDFWEDLFPPADRMRGRGSALQLISDRVGDWLGSTEFEQDDREALEQSIDDLRAVQEFTLEEMGEHAPSFSGLLNDLERAIDGLPAPDSDVTEEDESRTTHKAGEDETPSVAVDEDEGGRPVAPSAQAEIVTESAAVTAVTRAAAFLREEDLSSPIPYELTRAVQWGVLREAPPSEDGKTRVPAPREQRRTYLSGLLEEKQYEELVAEAESSFQTEPFHLWLDLQRLVASSLEALDDRYDVAHRSVLISLARLVRRMPSLTSLSFDDGTPFASPLTADWIENRVMPVLEGQDGENSSSVTRDGKMEIDRQYEEAADILRSGSLENALSHIREGAGAETSDKETFHRRLYAAILCMRGNKADIARPILDDLADVVDEYGLTEWNPDLAIEVWKHRCRCYDHLAQDAPADEQSALRAEANASFEKICRMDVERAVELKKSRSS